MMCYIFSTTNSSGRNRGIIDIIDILVTEIKTYKPLKAATYKHTDGQIYTDEQTYKSFTPNNPKNNLYLIV